MLFLYNLGIAIYNGLVALVSPFYRKAALWRNGRKGWRNSLKQAIDPDNRPVWIHCSSLGEFEQGRPLIEAMKQQNPDQKILLTFFSPSGYEVCKNCNYADYVFYLPLDTAKNAHDFLHIVMPQRAIFIKYEFWYHFLNYLEKQQIPTFVVSAIFRPNQLFFKPYGKWYCKFLNKFSHLFVQDERSKMLLGSVGIYNVTVGGDTRFDRVLKIANQAKDLPLVEEFCNDQPVLVAGSTWPKDEDFLLHYFNNYPLNYKLIIAPHEVHEARIHEIEAKFGSGSVRYTDAQAGQMSQYKVLIINTIGLLSSVYRYGQVAYVGGGFGKGIHNTLEAAAHGVPVIFGPNHKRFREALGLIECGGGFSFTSYPQFEHLLQTLQPEGVTPNNCGVLAQNFVKRGEGASKKILRIIS